MAIEQPALPTVKVVSDETEHGYIIINESDFDPAVHARYEAPTEGASKSAKRATKPVA